MSLSGCKLSVAHSIPAGQSAGQKKHSHPIQSHLICFRLPLGEGPEKQMASSPILPYTLVKATPPPPPQLSNSNQHLTVSEQIFQTLPFPISILLVTFYFTFKRKIRD